MRHTVLVVDDQWSMQELARMALQAAGYRVLLASDAVTGLCLARTEHPDVAVLDIHLADGQQGYLLHELQQYPKTAGIPVILITTPTEAMSALSHAGSCDYLQKPFQPLDLLRKVDGFVHRSELSMAV